MLATIIVQYAKALRGMMCPNKKLHTGVRTRIANAASSPEKPRSPVALERNNIRKIKLIG
jgi:hypothetical protein